MLPTLLLPFVLAGPAGREVPMDFRAEAFAKGARIPLRFTADGADASPALAWGAPPPATKAFALIVDDPDAPAGTWVHWVLYDLPASERSLAEQQPKAQILPSGARQGSNSWNRIGWNGPSPPPGKVHRYFFKLYALSAPSGLAPGATKAQLEQAMAGRILGEAQWMGSYGR